MRYKKLFVLLLALALLCGSLSGCASERQTAPAEPTVPFTDSLGRTVDIPETLTRVAPSRYGRVDVSGDHRAPNI